MAPIVHCVRHAQGYHNLSQDNHHLHDPRLTELGEQQCAALQSAFPYSDNLEVIIASPLKRTIYTALLSFAPAIKSRGIKVIALPEVSETSDLPCDTGSDLADLEKEFGSGEWAGVVDLSLCYEGWNVKTGKFAPSASAISGRAKEARLFLKERSEKELALVTHGGFLHYFTQDWSDSSLYLAAMPGTGWRNTEFRSYRFLDDSDLSTRDVTPAELKDEAPMIETDESRKQRGVTEPVPLRAEQERLYQKGLAKWSSLGLQNPAEMEKKEVNGV